MSTTPRTDARVAKMTGELKADEFIPADFARELERELAAAQARADAGEKDAKRLDWLDRRAEVEITTKYADCAYTTFIDGMHESPNIRAAIDAASEGVGE